MKARRGYSADDDSARMRAPEAGRKAKGYALRLLKMQDRTADELAGKMQAKGFTQDVITQVIGEMKSLGYLDDARYARHFAETRATYEGYGPIRIRTELQKRGVPRELVEGSVSQVFEGTKEHDTALALAQEWVARRGAPDEAVARRRLYGFLARRGFSPDVVARVLRETLGGW